MTKNRKRMLLYLSLCFGFILLVRLEDKCYENFLAEYSPVVYEMHYDFIVNNYSFENRTDILNNRYWLGLTEQSKENVWISDFIKVGDRFIKPGLVDTIYIVRGEYTMAFAYDSPY